MGFEIELMAPPGGSREALARTVAARVGGSVERFFHPQSEPSRVPGTPTFENLTPGFRVRGADGAPHASFVDDIKLQHGLDKQRAASPGWYRIVSDDARLLQLVITQCDPLAPLTQVLEPLAALFCTGVERHPSGMVKVTDARNASVALAASLPRGARAALRNRHRAAANPAGRDYGTAAGGSPQRRVHAAKRGRYPDSF